MKILVITIGSAGDVHPFIGLGVELKRRGHRVTLFTSDYFEREVRDAGLDFAMMSSKAEFQEVLTHPDLWHPVRGMHLLYKEIFGKLIAATYEYVSRNFVAGDTGVVTSTLGFGARIAQDKLAIPTVSVHLQPAVFRSVHDTAVYPKARFLLSCPIWLKRIAFRIMDAYIDRLIMPQLNAFRKTLGLQPVSRLFDTWFNSPQGVLGLFPDWYAAPQPDWPPQSRLAGFPLVDGGREQPMTDDLRRFLDAGEPPVVFTAGSAMKQGEWFFDAAVQACRLLKCRGVLINRFRDQVPEVLPDTVHYAEYAPFGELFPRARAVVHHGGIGTTAQVLAAGVPQLIVPLAFDQFDQAYRVERLGVGLSIPREQFSGPQVAEQLRELLNSPVLIERARKLAKRMDGPAAIQQACDFIEGVLQRK